MKSEITNFQFIRLYDCTLRVVHMHQLINVLKTFLLFLITLCFLSLRGARCEGTNLHRSSVEYFHQIVSLLASDCFGFSYTDFSVH